ncbi:MAG: chemotaxis protein CheB [Candidatus Eremiobacteraeota bacterium]|nr:chemotaxis protein CheB [Candidatus Eremiobacteraeota bacterium]
MGGVDARGVAHDIPVVVIGGSAGALDPLQKIVSDLPADFGAAVFVTTHVPRDAVPALPHLLGRAGPLFATHAIDRAPIAPGRIVVAPPNRHLLLADGVMRVIDGPTENGSRPSIDVTFRSAAAAFGSLACGILVSGTLDDGVAGMIAIHEAGGATFVQAPDDALFPEMPRHALDSGAIDRALPAHQMGRALEAWLQEVRDRPEESPPPPLDEREAGDPSVFTCPDCGGTLWEVDDEAVLRFRCRVGHAYSTESMLDSQGQALESTLWAAARALQERHDLLVRVASRAVEGNLPTVARRFEVKAREVRQHMTRLEAAIASLAEPTNSRSTEAS